jgi:hypothetical protein
MVFTNKYLNEENVLDIRSVQMSVLVTAVMTPMIVKTTMQLLILLLMKRIVRRKKKAKVILLVTLTVNSGFIWEDMDNYYGQHVLFSGHSGPQNSAVNIQETVSVFLLSCSRDILHKIAVETNHYTE